MKPNSLLGALTTEVKPEELHLIYSAAIDRQNERASIIEEARALGGDRIHCFAPSAEKQCRQFARDLEVLRDRLDRNKVHTLAASLFLELQELGRVDYNQDLIVSIDEEAKKGAPTP
jgi:hypothetical protein